MAWTKAKTAIVAGVIMLFAAGSATVLIEKSLTKHQGNIVWKQSMLQDVGQSTPENALQTFFWSMANGNGPRAAQCLSSLDSSLAELAVHTMTTGPGFQMFRNAWQTNNVGFEIINSTMPTSDTATYTVRSERPNGSHGTFTYCLKNEGGRWKILLNILMNGSRLEVNGFLKPNALH